MLDLGLGLTSIEFVNVSIALDGAILLFFAEAKKPAPDAERNIIRKCVTLTLIVVSTARGLTTHLIWIVLYTG